MRRNRDVRKMDMNLLSAVCRAQVNKKLIKILGIPGLYLGAMTQKTCLTMTYPSLHITSVTYAFLTEMANDDLSPRSSSYFLHVFSFSYAHKINKRENRK
jgi:hypothetical protein